MDYAVQPTDWRQPEVRLWSTIECASGTSSSDESVAGRARPPARESRRARWADPSSQIGRVFETDEMNYRLQPFGGPPWPRGRACWVKRTSWGRPLDRQG
uniref:Uncharacterized protein n=1 Tax=Coccidioides posadasii RMSCC 3488 TaxID=454284 RepID=A0A0J6FCI5_COCPO|nr:hypothetical protein CPAG_02942 [Coccidioides posadasii RMSCC 3488]